MDQSLIALGKTKLCNRYLIGLFDSDDRHAFLDSQGIHLIDIILLVFGLQAGDDAV